MSEIFFYSYLWYFFPKVKVLKEKHKNRKYNTKTTKHFTLFCFKFTPAEHIKLFIFVWRKIKTPFLAFSITHNSDVSPHSPQSKQTSPPANLGAIKKKQPIRKLFIQTPSHKHVGFYESDSCKCL